MYHAFRLAGRAGCVKDEQQIFCIHFLSWAGRIAHGFYLFNFIFPPQVSAFQHTYRRTGAGTNNYFFYRRTSHQSIVHNGFQRNVLCSTVGAIAGDNETALCILYPVGDRLSAETTEYNGVYGTYTGAGEYRYGEFRNHSHIYTYTISLLYAVVF